MKTLIPNDDTTPQNPEGDEYSSVRISSREPTTLIVVATIPVDPPRGSLFTEIAA